MFLSPSLGPSGSLAYVASPTHRIWCSNNGFLFRSATFLGMMCQPGCAMPSDWGYFSSHLVQNEVCSGNAAFNKAPITIAPLGFCGP